MAGYQRFILTGTLGKNVKIISMPSGPLGIIQVYCKENWTSKSGEKNERTQVFFCNIWGSRALALEHLLQKGSLVQVEGKIVRRPHPSTTDDDLKLDIVVDVENIIVHRVKENGQYTERD